jgi:hypothetical protein
MPRSLLTSGGLVVFGVLEAFSNSAAQVSGNRVYLNP